MRDPRLFTLAALLFVGAEVEPANSFASSLLDPTFNPGSGANALVYSIALQSDDRIIVGGVFSTFQGRALHSIVRLAPSGSLDATFQPGTGANDRIMSVAVQSDDKILVAGTFTAINGVPRNRVARLNRDGSVDPTFDPGVGPADAHYNFVYGVAPHRDGKVLVAGTFTQFNSKPANRIVRLNANGTLDSTFNVGSGSEDHWIGVVRVQDDGKILLGGWFTRFNGATHNRVVRLNPDGMVDSRFNVSVASSVYSLAVQTDGKILVGGHFTNVNDVARNRVARLISDGSLDMTFDPRGGANDWVQVLLPLSNGQILATGYFSLFDNVARHRVARLNSDGSLDLSFEADANEYVYTAMTQRDGRLLIGGGFTSIDGVERNYIARLDMPNSNIPNPKPLRLSKPVMVRGRFAMNVPTEVGQQYFIEVEDSLTGANWNPLRSFMGSGQIETVFDDQPSAAQRFYRCRAVSPSQP